MLVSVGLFWPRSTRCADRGDSIGPSLGELGTHRVMPPFFLTIPFSSDMAQKCRLEIQIRSGKGCGGLPRRPRDHKLSDNKALPLNDPEAESIKARMTVTMLAPIQKRASGTSSITSYSKRTHGSFRSSALLIQRNPVSSSPAPDAAVTTESS
jgi:hypothetical protein